MNRRVFASRIAEKTGHSAAAIDAILDAAISILAGELAEVGRFEWRGLGTFTVRAYPTRKIHVPSTGKTITLPARRSVGFKPSARLRSGLTAAGRLRPAPRRPSRPSTQKTARSSGRRLDR